MNIRPSTLLLCAWLIAFVTIALTLTTNFHQRKVMATLHDQIQTLKQERDEATAKASRLLDEGWRLGFMDGTNISRAHILDHYSAGLHDGLEDGIKFCVESLTNSVTPKTLLDAYNIRLYNYQKK
jgi:hypothetical protein